MEIKTIEDVKKEIGNKVKFNKGENVSANLEGLDILEGMITKITSSWEHTVGNDICTSWTANIDVTDPIDGGLHHLTATRIFSFDSNDKDIENIAILDEISKCQARIAELEARL